MQNNKIIGLLYIALLFFLSGCVASVTSIKDPTVKQVVCKKIGYVPTQDLSPLENKNVFGYLQNKLESRGYNLIYVKKKEQLPEYTIYVTAKTKTIHKTKPASSGSSVVPLYGKYYAFSHSTGKQEWDEDHLTVYLSLFKGEEEIWHGFYTDELYEDQGIYGRKSIPVITKLKDMLGSICFKFPYQNKNN